MAFRFDDDEINYLRTQQGGANLGQTLSSLASGGQNKKTGLLESVLSGIGNSIRNTGKGLVDLFGSGAASIADLAEGIGTGKVGTREQDFKKWLYNTDSEKDARLKSAGTAIDAASTISDFIPGLGAAAKVGLNVGQGVASGAAQNLIDNGENAKLEDSLKGAVIGGTSSLAGQAVGSKLGKAIGKGALSKAATSTLGRGAITGATSGAVGGGLATALNGGSAMDTLSGALQGAGGGAVGGAAAAGIMGAASKVGRKVNDKILGMDTQPTTKVAQNTLSPDETETKKGSMLGRALKKTGNQLESAQTDITRAERRKYGINDAGQTVENVRKRTGLSSIQDQADFARNITGAGDDSVMDTIQKYNMTKGKDGKPITLTTADYEVAINDAVGKNWKKSVMGKDYYDFRDDVIADIQNLDPIKAANNLKESAAIQRAIADGKGPTADKAAIKAKIYTEMANKIDDISYSAVPQENVNRMFDDTIDEFRTRAQEAKIQGNKKYAKAYENLAKDLEGTERTIANYRTFKKDFVKSSQLADISTGAQSGSLQAGIGKGTTVKNKILNTVLGEPSNRALAYAGGKLNDLGDAINAGGNGKALGKVGKAVGGVVDAVNTDLPTGDWQTGENFSDTWKNRDIMTLNDAANLPSIKKESLARGITGLNNLVNNQNVMTREISRQAGLSQARNIDADQKAQQNEQDIRDAINNAVSEYGADVLNYATMPENLNDTQRAVVSNAISNIPQTAQSSTQYPTAQTSTNGVLDRIGRAAELALNAGDLESYATLLDLYKQALSIYGTGETSSSAQQTKLTDNQTKAYNALQQLNTLEQMSPDLGTVLANSPLSGLVSLTGGNDYANQAQSLALTLGYLQSGANVSAKEAENIGKSYIPTALDSEQTRRNKLARARDLINGYLINTPYYQQ